MSFNEDPEDEVDINFDKIVTNSAQYKYRLHIHFVEDLRKKMDKIFNSRL